MDDDLGFGAQLRLLSQGAVVGAFARATGFGFEWEQYKTAEAYWQALRETIDAGESIHAANLEEILLIGYQEANDRTERQVKPLAPLGVAPETW